MKREEIVDQIRQIKRTSFPDATVLLYGSEARGDARPDSDIDLLVLLSGDHLSLKQEEEVTMPLYLLELKTGVSISPLVMTKQEWENRPFKTPFYVNVMNDGVAL